MNYLFHWLELQILSYQEEFDSWASRIIPLITKAILRSPEVNSTVAIRFMFSTAFHTISSHISPEVNDYIMKECIDILGEESINDEKLMSTIMNSFPLSQTNYQTIVRKIETIVDLYDHRLKQIIEKQSQQDQQDQPPGSLYYGQVDIVYDVDLFLHDWTQCYTFLQ